MILFASILILVSTLGFTVVLQMNFISLKKNHIKKMKELQSIATDLLKNQNELSKKISIIDSFENEYKNSRLYLNQEILALLTQFFKDYNEK